LSDPSTRPLGRLAGGLCLALLLNGIVSAHALTAQVPLGKPIVSPPIRLALGSILGDGLIDDAFPMSAGRVALLVDGYQVIILDSVARVVVRFGARGAGPGETKQARELAVVAGDLIVVGDPSQTRVVFRKTDGTHVRDATLGLVWTSMVPYRDGVLLRTLQIAGKNLIEVEERFLRPGSPSVSSLFKQSGPRERHMAGRGLFCSWCATFGDTSGAFVVAAMEPEYVFHQLRTNGSILKTFRGPNLPTVLPDSALQAKTAALMGRAGAKGAAANKLLLPFRSFTVTRAGGFDGSGNLWVLRTPPGQKASVVDVFDPQRRYRGTVQLSERLYQARVSGHILIGVGSDADDLPVVYRYRLDGLN
jgi:hypothetical protein